MRELTLGGANSDMLEADIWCDEQDACRTTMGCVGYIHEWRRRRLAWYLAKTTRALGSFVINDCAPLS
jgi:beta-xylosidase